MKKILSVLLAFVMICAAVPVSASEASTVASASAVNTEMASNFTTSAMPGITDAAKHKVSASAAVTASSVSQTAKKVTTEGNWKDFLNNPSIAKNTFIATTTTPEAGRITVPENGTLILQCAAFDQNGYSYSFKLGNYRASTRTLDDNSRIMLIPNVKKGTYPLAITSVSSGKIVGAAFASAVIPNNSNRTITGTKAISGSTGKTMYQQFKVSKRGLAYVGIAYEALYSDDLHSVTVDLQQKNGSKWTTIRSSACAYKAQGYTNTFGLNPGTYRIKYKTPDYAIVSLQCKTKAISATSFGKSQSKAVSISRGKSKSQVLVAGESKNNAQWYKFTVSSTRNIKLETTVTGSDGNIYFLVKYPSGSKITSKKSSNKITWTGKAKKGTYYIKVYKTDNKYSGAYTIKYVK